MDVFVEKLVAKKKDFKDYMIILATILGVFVLFFVVIQIPILGSLALFIFAGLVYGAYYLITSRNIEFEYIVTNGELDIDKIIAKRKRKRIFSASCKDFDILAKVKSSSYTPQVQSIKNRIEAVSSMDSDDVYFATLHYKGEKTVVFFEPDERMLNNFRTFIPKKVVN